MAVEQFCLKWNNFQTTLINAFGSLQNTEDLTDVTLTCEGFKIKAHKIILSACSPYFRSIFKENPCPHPVVILKDVSYQDLIAVLNFMYQGEVLITQDKLSSFLQTAEALQVSGLVGNMILRDVPSKPMKVLPPPELKTPKPKTKHEVISKTSKPTEKCDTIISDSIKVEISDDLQSDYNCNDKVDIYDTSGMQKLPGSILEAALEVQPSILERSLTSHSSRSPTVPYPLENVTVVQESPLDHIETDKKGVKHKILESALSPFHTVDVSSYLPQQKVIKVDDTHQKDDEGSMQELPCDISVLRTTPDNQQPHHSSQCGNCPHCGKTYSNQSALKYHVRLVHSDLTNMYCCHLCPESFDYREGYKKHMVEAHSVRN
uniref:BTB domain-containing protein n=1 Tax=Photinus pyralis TaxID=7054 RepID=A0A1Y1LGZ7_PHOPY